MNLKISIPFVFILNTTNNLWILYYLLVYFQFQIKLMTFS
jgi:hypothetical protein